MVAIPDEFVQDVGDESGRLGLVEADAAGESLLGERPCDVERVELVELTREEVEPHCACLIRCSCECRLAGKTEKCRRRISAGSTSINVQLGRSLNFANTTCAEFRCAKSRKHGHTRCAARGFRRLATRFDLVHVVPHFRVDVAPRDRLRPRHARQARLVHSGNRQEPRCEPAQALLRSASCPGTRSQFGHRELMALCSLQNCMDKMNRRANVWSLPWGSTTRPLYASTSASLSLENDPVRGHRVELTPKLTQAWYEQVDYFARLPGYAVLVFDNRGVGWSDSPGWSYTTREMALDVVELLDFLGWTQDRSLNVVGVSMGGMIAQQLVSLPSAPPPPSQLACFPSSPRWEKYNKTCVSPGSN